MRLGLFGTLIAAALAVVGLHWFVWALLALSTSSDNPHPVRLCAAPCPPDTTAWSFVFWIPELMLAIGFLLPLAPRVRRKWRVPFAWTISAFVTVVVLFFVYENDIRRIWSLPQFRGW
jgi:amino acid transporter